MKHQDDDLNNHQKEGVVATTDQYTQEEQHHQLREHAEEIITPPPGTLVAPLVIHGSSNDETALSDLSATEGKMEQGIVESDHDNLEDDPYGWIVVAAAFFVQFMVVGTVNGYGVYEVSLQQWIISCPVLYHAQRTFVTQHLPLIWTT